METNHIERFLRFQAFELHRKPLTIKDFRVNLEGIRSVLSLKTNREVTDALVAMQAERGWSDPTTYKRFSQASAYFKFCKREGLIQENPLADGFHFKKNASNRIEYFDWNDPAFKKLFLNPHASRRDKCIMLVLKSSGIRVSELCNLKIENVQGRWLEILRGKGGKNRMAPIDEETRCALGKYIAGLREYYSGEWLFPRFDFTGPIKSGTVQKMFFRLSKKMGVHIFAHKFRHSIARTLIMNGADLSVAKEVLGHSDIKTTARYTHFSKQDVLLKYDDALKAL